MSKAIAAGLYHPRCKDSHTTYFGGISTPPKDSQYTRDELGKIEEGTKRESKQQYASRQIEKYDRMSEYSLDPENKEKYEKKSEQLKTGSVQEESQRGSEILGRIYERHRVNGNLSNATPIDKLREDQTSGTACANYGKNSFETAQAFNNTIEGLGKEYITTLSEIGPMTRYEYMALNSSFASVEHDYSMDSSVILLNTSKKYMKDIERNEQKGYNKVMEKLLTTTKSGLIYVR